ncbi:MAG: hypothetical protein ACKOBT_13060, partial [Actinomycetota bacterium]
STLLTSAALTSMHTSVEALDDTSTRWKAGSNWEDALWQAVWLDVGSILPSLPDLVVLVTDGVPTRNRTNLSSDGDNTFQDADLSRAVTAATYARSTGAALAGILVGTGATPTALSNLQTVIGSDVTSGPGRSWAGRDGKGGMVTCPVQATDRFCQPGVVSSMRALAGAVLVPVLITMSPAMAAAVVPAQAGGVKDDVAALLVVVITPRRVTSVDASVDVEQVTDTAWELRVTVRAVAGQVVPASAATNATAERALTPSTYPARAAALDRSTAPV